MAAARPLLQTAARNMVMAQNLDACWPHPMQKGAPTWSRGIAAHCWLHAAAQCCALGRQHRASSCMAGCAEP
jgi:hypothetical protein